jgi:hypothetical protein
MKAPRPNPTQAEPIRFPITFDEMLQRLMPQVDKADERVARFRAYLKSLRTTIPQLEPEKVLTEVAHEIGELRQPGSTIGQERWECVAGDFGKWWKGEVSRKRATAGSKSGSKVRLAAKAG